MFRPEGSAVKYAGRVVAALALGSLAGSVRATPIAFDGFESYSAGSGLSGGSAGTGVTGPNGEFGWTSAWTAISGINVQSPGLTGARTGEADDATNSITAATRGFTPQTDTVYFSLQYNAAAGAEGSDFLHFYLSNDAAINNNSGGIGDIDTGLVRFGARVGGTNGGTTSNSASDYAAATTYLLVGKLSKTTAGNYNRIDLFINPAGTTEPGTADATQSGDAGIATVSVFALRTFNLDAGDKYRFDNVRIGTTFADVTPEPATVSLLLCGGLGLLARRRRRAVA
jgi:hypothetical protein